MPGAEPVTGTATGVDGAGRLEVRTAGGPVAVTAGDVVHVRPDRAAKGLYATMCTWPMLTCPRANGPS